MNENSLIDFAHIDRHIHSKMDLKESLDLFRKISIPPLKVKEIITKSRNELEKIFFFE